MSLQISNITAVNNINSVAAQCTLTLAPPETILEPVGGVQFAGDSDIVSGSNIRPNGSTIKVVVGSAGSIFSGVVDEMDDLEDPDQYTYEVVLSAVPISQAHKTRITLIHNQTAIKDMGSSFSTGSDGGLDPEIALRLPDGDISGTTHSILAICCNAVGIPLGRIDLPDVHVWGTLEFIRQNIMEIAGHLCEPFNIFEYQHYYIRCDERDGLQIIKVDFSVGGEVANLYELGAIEKKNRGFQRYNPDNRIGVSDVLLTGGDIYGNAASKSKGATTYSIPPGSPLTPGETPSADVPATLYERTVIAQHTYSSINTSGTHTASALDTAQLGGQSVVPEAGSRTESETVTEFVCHVTFQGDDPLADKAFTNGVFELNALIGYYASGLLTTLQIINSYTVETHQKTYIDGKLGPQTDTTSRYAYRYFPRHLYAPGERGTFIMISESSIYTTHDDDQDSWTDSKTEKSYKYSEYGIEESTTSLSYTRMPNGSWGLTDVDVSDQDSPSTTQAELEYDAAKRNVATSAATQSALMAAGYSAEEASAFVNPPDTAKTTFYPTLSGAANPQRTLLGKYQLLNGYELPLSNTDSSSQELGEPYTSASSGDTGLTAYYHDYPAASTADEAAPTPFASTVRGRAAFHIDCPWMDYYGLTILWNMAQREKALEKAIAFWEIVRVSTASLDTTPAAGEPLIASGSSGFVQSVTHTITDSEAVTSVEIKRLVW